MDRCPMAIIAIRGMLEACECIWIPISAAIPTMYA
jgi:hypothetical protein